MPFLSTKSSRNRALYAFVTVVAFVQLMSFDLQHTVGSYAARFGLEQSVLTTQIAESRIAVVFKTKTINVADACLCERFVALVESMAPNNNATSNRQGPMYDVILLHEPNEKINPLLLEWIQESRHRDRVKVVPAPLASSYFDETINGFRQWPTEKANFILWIHELHVRSQRYSHYWLVEDDVFWTGKWRHFFESNDLLVGAADFVSVQFEQKKEYWEQWIVNECQVNGEVCWDNETGMISRTMNNLFRISDHFAAYLLELLFRNSLRGHDEANFIAAFKQTKTMGVLNKTFTHAQLFSGEAKKFHGLDVMGGWSVWTKAPAKPIYSLRGIAKVAKMLNYGRWWDWEDAQHFTSNVLWDGGELTKQAKRGLETTYKSNLEVPPNKIWHPVKCPADPGMGAAALAFATGENDLESAAIRALQSACRS